MRQLQFALRRLRASPTFTVAAILTLAIAIGATTSVFSLADGVLFKAFPYRDPDRELNVFESNPDEHLSEFPFSSADYLDYRQQATSFTGLAAGMGRPVTVTGTQQPERIWAIAVTPNWFDVLGLSPAVGRFLALDSLGPAEVVISNGYWQRHFGGSPSAIGRTLTLDDKPYTIVGVMPPGYFNVSDEFWTRLSFTAEDVTDRARHFVFLYGRLKPGVSREFADRELQTIARRLAGAYPKTDAHWSAVTLSLVDDVGGRVRPAMLALLAAAGCVLLIGAANIANLFLVRCLSREREMAVRSALGATRSHLASELLTEAGTLGLAGGLLGVAMAVGGAHVLRELAPSWIPRLNQVGIDGRVLAFSALASVGTVFVFGALPAWQASRASVADFLKQGGRATGSAQRHRLQNGLVILQVAVALVLLTGASLLAKSFGRLRHADPGFEPRGVLTAQIDLPARHYATPDQQVAFDGQVVDQLAAQPGVEGASISDALPDAPGGFLGFTVVGNAAPASGETPTAYAVSVSPDYFRVIGIRLLRGRSLLRTDDGHAIKVVVIDAPAAQQAFGNRDPLGRRLALHDLPDTLTVVGIVNAVEQAGPGEPNRPVIYMPFAQYPSGSAYLAVRTSADPNAERHAITRVVNNIDPGVPVSDIETMTWRIAQSVSTTRFSSALASLFALIALLLGAVGIYSVLAYVVSERQRDIAVRIALGARSADVVGDVIRRAMLLAGVGIALGSIATWWLTRALASLFLGVSPHDPATFLGAAAGFVVIALAAASVPAYRTTRISPVVALTST